MANERNDKKKTLMTSLDDLSGSRRYSMFVVWYCTDESERESWEDFTSKNGYDGIKWEYVRDNWLLDEGINKAIKYYMKLQHNTKMKKIYDKMYEQALAGDVQSAKYIIDFSKDFFASEKEDELEKLLGGITIGEDDE